MFTELITRKPGDSTFLYNAAGERIGVSILAWVDECDTVEALTEALERIAANTCCGSCQEARLVASAALAKVSP
jgi:hypothetical protein